MSSVSTVWPYCLSCTALTNSDGFRSVGHTSGPDIVTVYSNVLKKRKLFKGALNVAMAVVPTIAS
jgi:hypothetical protein